MPGEEFFNLPLTDQVKVLYTRGEFVVNIRWYGYKVNLFALADYYVEVFYNHKEDRIERISLLDQQHSRFKFFQDQIKLPVDLLN